MLAGPRFALLEFLVLTSTTLENSDLENSDFSKSKIKRHVNWRKKLTFRSLITIIELCSTLILNIVRDFSNASRSEICVVRVFGFYLYETRKL